MNFMLGITFSDWKKLLKENEYSLDPANYFNAVRITLFSIANSRMRRKENKIYSNDIARTEILSLIHI
jgi:hypothetical protein